MIRFTWKNLVPTQASSIDDFSHLWDGSQPGWKLCRLGNIILDSGKSAYLPISPDGDGIPIEDNRFASEVVNRMLEANVPVQHVPGVELYVFQIVSRIAIVSSSIDKQTLQAAADKLRGWEALVASSKEFGILCSRFCSCLEALQGVNKPLANRLVRAGFLSFGDLAIMDDEDLADCCDISVEQAKSVIDQAENLCGLR